MQNNEPILAALFKIIQSYIAKSNLPENKVVDYLTPTELKRQMDIAVGSDGETFEQLLGHISQYLKYAVDTGNRQFFNQLYAGFNLPAFMGEVVTALATPPMYTSEVAPLAPVLGSESVQNR